MPTLESLAVPGNTYWESTCSRIRHCPERILNQIKKKKAFSFPLAYDFNCIRDACYYNSSISDETKYLMVKGIGLNDREFGHIGYLLIISDETEKRVKRGADAKQFGDPKSSSLVRSFPYCRI